MSTWTPGVLGTFPRLATPQELKQETQSKLQVVIPRGSVTKVIAYLFFSLFVILELSVFVCLCRAHPSGADL